MGDDNYGKIIIGVLEIFQILIEIIGGSFFFCSEILIFNLSILPIFFSSISGKLIQKKILIFFLFYCFFVGICNYCRLGVKGLSIIVEKVLSTTALI